MNFLSPIPPATAGPVCMPTRNSRARPVSARRGAIAPIISSPMSALRSAGGGGGRGGAPAALGGREPRRQLGDPDAVREEDGHLVEAIGDDHLAPAQPRGDRGGQDVQQQPLVLAMGPLPLTSGRDVRAVDVDETELRDVDGLEGVGPAAALDLDGLGLLLFARAAQWVGEVKGKGLPRAQLERPRGGGAGGG